MLTRVEISGFRNFSNFEARLRPFVVIAGPNAAGKSNFFDSLKLLSALANLDSLEEAFKAVRGDPLEQFSFATPGRTVKTMKFAVEAVIPTPTVRDPWGDEASLTQTHLRYELGLFITDEGSRSPKIQVESEALTAVRRPTADPSFAASAAFRAHILRRARRAAYIATERNVVSMHQDGKQGRKREYAKTRLTGTVLSSATSVAFKHAYAMRRLLADVRFLQLEPSDLREASPLAGAFSDVSSESLSPKGRNLPAVLNRLQLRDERTLPAIARDLRKIVPEVRAVSVRRDEVERKMVAMVEFDHGGPFPASLVSDGTLRLLALAALKNDSHHNGVLCFEEPENGVHPLRMRGLVELLRGLATDVEDSGSGSPARHPLRQVLVNTHSPALVSQLDANALLFAQTYRHMSRELDGALQCCRFLPVRDELPLRNRDGAAPTHITRTEVEDYLASVNSAGWNSGVAA